MGRNGPALWDALLNAVRLHTDKDVLIAGGCLRDYALGLEPKDIDICVACETREELEQLGDELNEAGLFDVELIRPDEDSDSASNGEGVPDLIGVLDGEAFDIPVNLIARTHHQEGMLALLHGFDFCILRASYDGADTYWSPEALEDIRNRTATLTDQATVRISYPRFCRFNQRNPGVLKFVDPYQGDFDFV